MRGGRCSQGANTFGGMYTRCKLAQVDVEWDNVRVHVLNRRASKLGGRVVDIYG